MQIKNNNNPKPFDKVLDFLKQNWMYILGLIFIVPYIKRYLDDAETERAINKSKNEAELKKQSIENVKTKLKVVNSTPKAQQFELNKVTTKPQFQNIAKSIFQDMGLNRAWYDPRQWTENDDDVVKALKPVKSKNDMFKVKQCYFIVSGGRDMYVDLKTYLPASDFASLKNLI